ncbi:hypothetical protein D3C77_83640 [compost metagenome]
MNNIELLREEKSALRVLEKKMHSRNRLIVAVYAASHAELERAAVAVKAALRGSGPSARPRSFRSLEDEFKSSKPYD